MTAERIVLVGMMGAGKTTVGRLLATRLGRPYVDNDDLLRARTGADAAAIAATRGTATLHALERDAFLAGLEQAVPVVLAAPGSVVLDPTARERLRREWVVWLRADLDTLAARAGGSTHRPLAPGSVREVLARLAPEREPWYAELADLVVDVAARTPDGIAATIAAALPADPG